MFLSNLAFSACLRRGGARRAQLLASTSVPITAILAYCFLGEIMSATGLAGGAITLAGVALAVGFERGRRASTTSDPISSTLAAVVGLGLVAAACRAAGFIVIKPAMVDGTDPLAASALRLGAAAITIVVVALWPARVFEPITKPTGSLVTSAILPGILGYVVATSMLIYALRHNGAGLVAALASTVPVIALPLQWMATGVRPAAPASAGAGLAVIGTAIMALG